MGAINFKKGNYAKAIDNYKKALEINEKKEDQNVVCLNRLLAGYTYFMNKEYMLALDYSRKALDISEKIDDKNTLIVSSILIGKINLLLNNSEAAGQYFNRAVDQADALGDSKLKIVSLGNIAMFFKAKGDVNACNKYLELLKQNDGTGYISTNEVDASKIDRLLYEIIEEKDYFTRLWL